MGTKCIRHSISFDIVRCIMHIQHHNSENYQNNSKEVAWKSGNKIWLKKVRVHHKLPKWFFFLLLLKVIFHNSLQNHLPSGHVYNFHVTIFRKKYQMIIIFLKISIKRPVQPLFNDGNKRWKTRMIKNWVCLISMQCLINSKYMLITWKKYKSYSGKSGFLFPAIDLLLAYLQRYCSQLLQPISIFIWWPVKSGILIRYYF